MIIRMTAFICTYGVRYKVGGIAQTDAEIKYITLNKELLWQW